MVIFGVPEPEPVEVNDDRRDTERDADCALPPLGHGAAPCCAVLLVENGARGRDGDHRFGEVGSARVIVDIQPACEEEEHHRDDERRVPEGHARLAQKHALTRVNRGEVRRRTDDDGHDGERGKVHSSARGVTQCRRFRRCAATCRRGRRRCLVSHVGAKRCHGHTRSVGCTTRSIDRCCDVFAACVESCMVASCPILCSRPPQRHRGISRLHWLKRTHR